MKNTNKIRKDRNDNVITEGFDNLAQVYETNRLSSWYRAHGEIILDALDTSEDGAVLDIGCATGWFLRQILRKYPELHGIGIDVSSEMIHIAREKALEESIDNLVFFNHDWDTLDSADFSKILVGLKINTVICASSLHYFSDPLKSMRKIFEILLPGGQFLLMERAKDGSLLTLLWDSLHRLLIRDHVRFYHTSELIELLKQVGFVPIEIKSKIRRFFWRGKIHTSMVLISARKPSTVL